MEQDDRPSLSGAMRRAVDGALDATVGRVGHSVTEAARDATGSAAHQIIEDLEPFLIEEAIPRILEGLQPYLTDEVVPEVMDGVSQHLAEVTVPQVVDNVTDHLASVTVPQIVERATPQLAEELIPRLLDDLRPYLEQEFAPALVESLTPFISNQVAPELVDALMPKIRDEVVPQIMDDFVEDPRVRDLIREQSQGLFLDALETLRATLAHADTLVENVGRRLVFRRPRPRPESAMDLVLADEPKAERTSVPRTLAQLRERQAQWRHTPHPPPPAGRNFAYAGLVTRALGLAIDVTVVGFLTTQFINALISILEAVFGSLPDAATLVLIAIGASAIPVYLAASVWLAGRTIGMAAVGTRICVPDGAKPGFVRAVLIGWLSMLGLVFWAITGVVSFFDGKRRTLLDVFLRTEVRYSVPENQQQRHLRDAVQERREGSR